MPGPGDILALGVLYNLVRGFIAGDGLKSSMQTLHFSKVARGNQRDTELQGVTDSEIAEELSRLTGNLNKQQKARKRKLQKEQKARGQRNKQKKGSEKGTGTGRI